MTADLLGNQPGLSSALPTYDSPAEPAEPAFPPVPPSSSSSSSCLTVKQTDRQTDRPLLQSCDDREKFQWKQGSLAGRYNNSSVSIGMRVPRGTALEIWGLCREWHLPVTQVILRLLGPTLAENGRVAEIGRQKQLLDDTRDALAELQERVAEKDTINLELQKALEKAQAQLREAAPLVGEKKVGKVSKWAIIAAKATHLHPTLEAAAVSEKMGKAVTIAPPGLVSLRSEQGSWANALQAARDAAATLAVVW